jgi:hypothetical protein
MRKKKDTCYPNGLPKWDHVHDSGCHGLTKVNRGQ